MLRIFRDDETTPINEDYVYKVHFKRQAYDDKFFLGATPCREVELEIDKQAYNTQPTTFRLTEYNGTTDTPICTIYVDDVDTTNDYYYSYKCLDAMVKFNCDMEFTEDTVYNLLAGICTKHGITGPVGIVSTQYPWNIVVSWSDYCTEREFISYAAELACNIAYISNYNRLAFDPVYSTTTALSGENMADITVGAQHRYTRLVYDSVVHYEYGTNDGETLYLNPNNILFGDNVSTSTTYNTLQKQVNRIGLSLFG